MARRQADASPFALMDIPVLTGGLNLRSDASQLRPDQSQQLVNFSLREPGALPLRKGSTHFSTTALSTGNPPLGARRIYLNTAVPNVVSTAFTVVSAADGQIYTISDAGVWTSTRIALGSTGFVEFVHDRDLVAAFDGGSPLYKSTNGSVWTKFGIAVGAVSTLASGTVGSLSSAEFEVAYTYKDRDLAYESNGSAVSTLTLGSTGSVQVDVPNTADSQVDAIVLYARNKTAGETTLRKVSSFAMGSTAGSSTSRLTSSAWTSGDPVPTTHAVPPALDFGCVWKNRWWAKDTRINNRLRFTELFFPQAWAATFYLDLPFLRGDSLKAIIPAGDALVIFGDTTGFLITGETSLDFDVKPALGALDGALGPRAVAATELGIAHGGASGVYLFDGTTDQVLSDPIEPAWRDLVTNGTPSQLRSVAIVHHAKQKELRIAVARRYPSGAQGELVLDLRHLRASGEPGWAMTDRAIAGYIPWDGPESGAGNRGRLFSWSSTAVRLFEEDTGENFDDGVKVIGTYQGPDFVFGDRKSRVIDVAGLVQAAAGANVLVGVQPYIDGVPQPSQAIAVPAAGGRYDTSTYDVATYAASQRRQWYAQAGLNAEGRVCSIALTMSSTTPSAAAGPRLYSYRLRHRPEASARHQSDGG